MRKEIKASRVDGIISIYEAQENTFVCSLPYWVQSKSEIVRWLLRKQYDEKYYLDNIEFQWQPYEKNKKGIRTLIEKNKKPVKVKDKKTGLEYKFPSVTEAASVLSVSVATITNVCLKRRANKLYEFSYI